jgi:alpha-tubulin suppressor-like RCC1 family protein
VLTGAVALGAGSLHTCALTQAGGVLCWGANGSGQLGDGSLIGRTLPPVDEVLTEVQAISVGRFRTCALLKSGSVACWGDNTFGALGDGKTEARTRPTPTLPICP